MNQPEMAFAPAPDLTAEVLHARVNHEHAGQALVEDCLSNTRVLATETTERSALLYFAMTVLGQHPKGTSAVSDFTALFTELGLTECAETVRTGRYQAEDLAFFWSGSCDFSRLFEASDLAPAETYSTCEQHRPLSGTLMSDEWEDNEFYVFDTLKDSLPPKNWHLYQVENATIVYDTTEFAVLDSSGRPVPDLCSQFYQHVFFTPLFGEQLDRLLLDDGDSFSKDDVLTSALMIQDLIPAPNYCHWLLDQLPRTSQLDASQHLIMHTLAPFMKNMLEKMGINGDRVVETNRSSIIRVERLSIESSMARHFHHPCQEMNSRLVQYVKDSLQAEATNVPADRQRRNVYISRNRTDRRRISNEAALLECLEPFDFDVVYPEELSLAEQISIFRNASVIVTPHGASLANIIFCEQATIVEIFNQNYGTPTFRLMSQLMGFDYQHIIGKNPLLSTSEQQRIGRAQLQKEDIDVDIAKLNECLAKIFHRADEGSATRASV